MGFKLCLSTITNLSRIHIFQQAGHLPHDLWSTVRLFWWQLCNHQPFFSLINIFALSPKLWANLMILCCSGEKGSLEACLLRLDILLIYVICLSSKIVTWLLRDWIYVICLSYKIVTWLLITESFKIIQNWKVTREICLTWNFQQGERWCKPVDPQSPFKKSLYFCLFFNFKLNKCILFEAPIHVQFKILKSKVEEV